MKKIIIYYFFFLLSIFSLLSSGVIDSQDGFQYLAVARNIYYTGKPTAPVYEYNERKNVHLSTYLGKDGNTYSPTGLGYSLAMLPAVAITDIIYKIYGVSPPQHFPLENDWLILLTTSFTNGFFASSLGVILFLYLIELGLSKKQALFISFAGLFTTNLLVYAKHSFPHMMFMTFLFLAFFLIKKHFLTNRNPVLIFAGLSFGIVSITYNQTFLLTTIPLGLYFLTLSKFRLNFSSIKFLLSKFIFFFLGFLPFIIIYFWFENLRSGASQNLADPLDLVNRATNPFRNLPITVFFEGLYGQLFSPGRSVFLYSPILLLIIFFRHRIKKAIFSEVWAFLLLSIIYILFYASLYSIGKPEQGIAGLWHGESSWGPRYLSVLIPFGILIIGFIYTQLNKFEKRFVFYPLLLLGLFVELLGIVMPYQIKFHELEHKFFVNSTEYPNYTYSNLLPRYSPVVMMSKKLIKLIQTVPTTLDHSIYNVRFYDGVEFPFSVGGERWRVVDGRGYISFDNPDNSIKKITMGLINHPIEEASYSAVVKVFINDHQLQKEGEAFLPTERKLIDLIVPENLLKPKHNQLIIDVQMKSLRDDSLISEINQYRDDPASYTNKNKQPTEYIPQILGMISFSINGQEINKESLDFPYVSSLGPVMMGVKYNTYGGKITDPWRFWELHTQVYERTPDFWWMTYLYYWDIPKISLILLFIGSILAFVYFSLKTFKSI